MEHAYIHGTQSEEQERLMLLNRLTNPPFLKFLELKPQDHILEIGSGLGILAAQVAEQLPEGKMTGIEYAEDQLKKAPKDIPNLHFVQGDAHHLPFDDNSFDVVYGRYILEHVFDPRRVVSEIRRVLKPGGHVFLQENNIRAVDFYPDCPAFMKAWNQFIELQGKLGGDALIGKKLHALLSETSFSDIQLSVATEIHHFGQSTYPDWLENLKGNVESARESLLNHDLLSEKEYQQALDELEQLKYNALGSAYFYWNRASAIK